jgi:hypothetical protein
MMDGANPGVAVGERATAAKANRPPPSLAQRAALLLDKYKWALALLAAVLTAALKLVKLGAEQAATNNPIQAITQITPQQWPDAGLVLIEGLLAGAAVTLVVSYTVNNFVIGRIGDDIIQLNQQVTEVQQNVSSVEDKVTSVEEAVAQPIEFPKELVNVVPATRAWLDQLSSAENSRLKSEIRALQMQLTDTQAKLDAQLKELEQLQAEQTELVETFGNLQGAETATEQTLQVLKKVREKREAQLNSGGQRSSSAG